MSEFIEYQIRKKEVINKYHDVYFPDNNNVKYTYKIVFPTFYKDKNLLDFLDFNKKLEIINKFKFGDDEIFVVKNGKNIFLCSHEN